MFITEISVRRPIMVLMVFLGIFLFGLISIPRLSTDFLPKMEPPAISVIVPYPGASAEDVENDVTKHLEDWLSTVEDLDKLTSLSKDNLSLVVCHFDWGVDLEAKANDVRDKLDMAVSYIKEHAPDAESPILFKFSSSTAPVMVLSISADKSWPMLYRLVDKSISDPIKRIKGVGTVIAYGGLIRQIQINFDWDKLNAYGLNVLEVANRLREENVDLPLGDVKMGRRRYVLRLKGRFTSAKDIGNILVAVRNGQPIYLKDIAKVEDGFEEMRMKAWSNGRKAVVLVVQKQTGANSVNVCRRIKKFLCSVRDSLPPDVKISIDMDTSEFILNAMKNLRSTLVFSALLVILIVLIFLRRKTSSFIVSLSIPFSLIITFIFLYLNNYTINVISMMSLAIAIGMVVDNAIVVLENSVRHIEEGMSPSKAAVLATQEVAGAITASTLTTISVFLPLIFVKGMAGIVFHQLGSIVSMTLLASLFVSLTLTPSLAAHMLKKQAQPTILSRLGDWVIDYLQRFYYPILNVAVSRPRRIFIFMFGAFLAVLFLIRFVGTELFPVVDTGDVRVNFSLSESSRLEETEKVTKEMMRRIERLVPERRSYYGFIGETKRGISVALGFDEGPNIGEVGVKLIDKEKRKRSAEEIAEALRRDFESIPGINKYSVVATTPTRQMLMGSGRQIEVEVIGPDLDKVYDVAKQIEKKMRTIKGAVDIRISQKQPRQEIVVVPDREKMARLGISTSLLANTLRAGYYGIAATKFRDAGEDFDIFIRLKKASRTDISQIKNIPIAKVQGKTVYLKDIARIEERLGPVEIQRKNRERMISVGCNVFGRPMGDVKDDIVRFIHHISIPANINIEFGGEVEEQKKAFSSMRQLLIVGIILVYMVMAAQFESVKSPFIIFFSVPFAFTGVILGLFLTGTPLSIMSFMGLIMLMGVVVNNAIVLVDYANQLRNQGKSVVEAITTAAKVRLRPIVMTSLTTILGLLPLTVFRAQGAEMWRAFGITAVSGLVLSSIVSLVIIPAMYVWMNKERWN